MTREDLFGGLLEFLVLGFVLFGVIALLFALGGSA
jgi:hypothetical protein